MSIHRSNAKKALAAAKSQIARNEDQSLKYAALELRMAIEAITYDKALAYKDEFPPEEYETWQPKKIMLILLEIDPSADTNSSLSFGVEPFPGQAPAQMKSLGTEVIFNLKTIKKHYDALGSYLHSLSLQRIRSGVPLDYKKFRKRCEEISAELENCLSSPVFNCTIGMFSSFDCLECANRIRKRIPLGASDVDVDCFNCLASYTLTRTPDGAISADIHEHETICGNKNCDHVTILLRRQIVAGTNWKCLKCQGHNEIRLSVFQALK